MHQDHNIPWNLLASHLKFVHHEYTTSPPTTNLYPRDKPTQGKELNYFVEALCRTVQQFSQTERAKYPAKFPNLGTWDESKKALASSYRSDATQDASQGDRSHEDTAALIEKISTEPEYADEIIALFQSDNMEPLLALANQHPHEISRSHNESPGRAYVPCGWLQLARHSLRFYLLLNLIEAIPEARDSGNYRHLPPYTTVLHELVSHALEWDWAEHRSFLLDPKHGHQVKMNNELNAADVFKDYDKLQDYLSDCFRTVYKYHMLATECGLGWMWKDFVKKTVHHLWEFKTENQYEVDDWGFV